MTLAVRDILVLHYDILAFFVLIALDDLIARDRFVLGLTVDNLLDSRAIVLVKLIEADVLAACCREQTHGNRNQPKCQMTFPNARRHG